MTQDKEVTERFQILQGVKMTPTESEAVWEKISQEMQKTRLQPPSRRKNLWFVPAAAAAAVVAIFAGSFFSHHPFAPRNANSLGSTVQSHQSSTDEATSVEIVSMTETTNRLNVTYPEIRGMTNKSKEKAINTTLKQMAVDPKGVAKLARELGTPSNPVTVDSGYIITYQRGNLVDFVFQSQAVTPKTTDGGTGFLRSAIFNLHTGHEYAMTDLFDKHSGYLTTLSQLVKQADAQHMLGQMTPYPTVKTTDPFLLTNRGFAIGFQQGQWTPMAAGTPTFPIRFSQVDGLINKSGPFWTSLMASEHSSSAKAETANIAYLKDHGYTFAASWPHATLLAQYLAVEPSTKPQKTLYAMMGMTTKGHAVTEKVFFFAGTKLVGTALPSNSTIKGVSPGKTGTFVVESQGNTPEAGILPIYYVSYHWNGTRMIAGKKQKKM